MPVLVTRYTTERPEGVDADAVRIVGTDATTVRDAVLELLDDPGGLATTAGAGRGIYGDGTAATRIVAVLAREAVGT